jgi:hypothetical protein
MEVIKNGRLLVLAIIVAVAFHACKKTADEFTSSPVTLTFSTDSIQFDTIFTQLDTAVFGTPRSITLQLRVTNPSPHAVKTNIRLAGVDAGNTLGIFKLNVDGKPGTSFSNVEIRGNDSIFIFIQAYIMQVSSNTPFLITDQILFETNGNKQHVDIVARGQDAIFYNNEELSCGSSNLNWTRFKPYVIYNSVLVPAGCTLTIDAGTHIYSHPNSSFLVAGTLIVNGTPDDPVIFEGDRLDQDYKEVAGQWWGIRFLGSSVNNIIRGAVIKNGITGIEVDTMSLNSNPTLTVKQTIIRNMAYAGFYNIFSHVRAENTLISDCGYYSFVGRLGNYELYNNTFVTYSGGRQDPGFVLTNSPVRDPNTNEIIYKQPLNFTVINNIVYGSADEEAGFVINDPDGIPVTPQTVSNNLFRTKSAALVPGNLVNEDPLFNDPSTYKYDVRGNSPCKGAGAPITTFGYSTDLRDKPRSSQPTIGAYE